MAQGMDSGLVMGYNGARKERGQMKVIKRRVIKVWAYPTDKVVVCEEGRQFHIFPYDSVRILKLDCLAFHLYRRGWTFVPFLGLSVGWVAISPGESCG